MKTSTAAPTTVDEYIAACPPDVRPILKKVRAAIKKAAPGAEEVISYRMPAIRYGEGRRPVVYYAAARNHLGVYPMASTITRFKHELKHYRHAKGSIQFPWTGKMPIDLITKIVKFRVKEAREALARN